MHGEKTMQGRISEEAEHDHPVEWTRVAKTIMGQSFKMSIPPPKKKELNKSMYMIYLIFR